MASPKLLHTLAEEGEELKMDMSPMIDLVFLLLIFFMVSSHLIIVKIDKSVDPPVAEAAKAPENAEGRIVVNIHADGSTYTENGRPLEGREDIREYVDEIRRKNLDEGVASKLHVRAHKDTDTRHIKRVVSSAAEAEVIDVIFAAYVVEKKR